MKFFIVVLAIIGGAVAQGDPKYCDATLCTRWDGVVNPHIACPGNAPTTACPTNARPFNVDSAFQAFILQKHNSYRNSLAGGSVNGFATAARLAEITWDAELAYIAAQNVQRCAYGHDKCRNTAVFKYAGQNIGMGNGAYTDDRQFAGIIIDSWWGENKDATQAVLDKYASTTAVIGHFTAMANDRTNKIGCAGMFYGTNPTRIFACNYGYTNMMNEPVYVKGAIRSKCTAGASTAYPNLCSASEPVKAVPFNF